MVAIQIVWKMISSFIPSITWTFSIFPLNLVGRGILVPLAYFAGPRTDVFKNSHLPDTRFLRSTGSKSAEIGSFSYSARQNYFACRVLRTDFSLQLQFSSLSRRYLSSVSWFKNFFHLCNGKPYTIRESCRRFVNRTEFTTRSLHGSTQNGPRSIFLLITGPSGVYKNILSVWLRYGCCNRGLVRLVRERTSGPVWFRRAFQMLT